MKKSLGVIAALAVAGMMLFLFAWLSPADGYKRREECAKLHQILNKRAT